MKGLDEYITGHYGEDQFKDGRNLVDKWYKEGQTARQRNRPFSECPYYSGPKRQGWALGWTEEDMAIMCSD
jgi:ribosome modulation factor